MKRVSITALVFLLLFASASAFAATHAEKREAKKLSREAAGLVKKGDLDAAATKYQEADEISPTPSTKLGLAKVLLEQGELIGAGQVLREAADISTKDFREKKAKKEANALLEQVNQRTPKLEIEIFEPAASEVTISIDDEEFDIAEGAISLNPGNVEVVATAEGYETWTKKLELKEGVTKAIEITLKASDSAADTASEEDDGGGTGVGKIPAYAAWGVGVIGLGLGIGFGVAAIQTTNDVLALYDCEDGECPKEAEADLDVAKTNGNVSTAGFVIAGIGLTAGTILWFVLPDDDEAEEESEPEEGRLRIEARPLIGPGYLGVAGSF
jgi:tetratricopeptide (TPR) repeat protein